MLAALLLPLCTLAEGDPPPVGLDPDAPTEEIEVWPADALRDALDQQLHDLGLVHVHRRGDAVVYRGRERWKPRMVVHDDGWVEIRDPPLEVDSLSILPLPPFIVIRGKLTGRRLREGAKAELVENTAPIVRAWQEAVAAEIADGRPPPRQDAPGFGLADAGRLVLAEVTQSHPDDWAPEHRALLPEDLERADRDYVDDAIATRVTSDPRVLTALRTVPRSRFLAKGTEATASRQGPAGGEEGAWVASAAQVAWIARAARIEPSSRLLELSTEAGYRTAVLAALGATVHHVDDSGPRLARLRDLVAGLGLTVATRLGDPGAGWAEAGPFDAILLDPGLSADPAALAPQLVDGGVLLLLGGGESLRLRWEAGALHEEHLLDLTAPDLSSGARRQDHGGRRPWDER
ncbi:MAG: hypothetical protein ABIO70_01275 [Pseudomonadota bacterium]